MAPGPRRGADDEGIRVLLRRRGGEFPGGAAPAGEHVYVEAGRVGRLVKLRPQPFLQVTGALGQAYHLAAQRFAVHAGRRHVDHEQGPPETPGHARRVGERVAAGR